MKKLTIILLILMVFGIGGYFIWKYFFQTQENVVVQPPPPPIDNQAPIDANKAVLNLLGGENVFDYWTSDSGKIYYISLNGEIYEINGSDEKKITSQPIQELNYLKPSFDGKFILLSFGGGLEKSFSVFDTETLSWNPMPEGAVSADWRPNKYEIGYTTAPSQGESTVNIMNAETKKTSLVTKFNARGVELDWAQEEKINLLQKPSSVAESGLWSIDLKTKTIKNLASDLSLVIKWNKNGSFGLKYNNFISLIDADARVLASSLPTTLPSKCVFVEKILYCAFPRLINKRDSFLDDYLKKKLYTEDDFSSIDTETGALNKIFDSGNALIDADKLRALNNETILFINRYDNKIYSLKVNE